MSWFHKELRGYLPSLPPTKVPPPLLTEEILPLLVQVSPEDEVSLSLTQWNQVYIVAKVCPSAVDLDVNERHTWLA